MMCLLHAVLSIGFEQLQYTFAEGTSKQMCVLIDGYVEISIFQADLSFVPGTAGELCILERLVEAMICSRTRHIILCTSSRPSPLHDKH